MQYAKIPCLSVSCKKKNQTKTNGKLKLGSQLNSWAIHGLLEKSSEGKLAMS